MESSKPKQVSGGHLGDKVQLLEKIRAGLEAAAEGGEYAKFNERIYNTQKRILGARTPKMRKLAKVAARNLVFKGGVEALKQMLVDVDPEVFEEVMCAGFVVMECAIRNGKVVTEAEVRQLIDMYLPLADSWALIDSFSRKSPYFYTDEWFEFAARKLTSEHEFTARFGVVLMMQNFLTDKYISKVFAALKEIKHEGYYVKMAVAWTLAEAAAVANAGEVYTGAKASKSAPESLNPRAGENEALSNVLDLVLQFDDWTRNKALQKMVESRRFTEAQKDEFRRLKGEESA